jgi:hypothetical protein
VFSFAFEARNVGEVKVASVEGFSQVDINPALYTVAIEPSGIGGSVTFTVAPENGMQLYIYRETAQTQLVGVSSQARYDPEVVETVWDKLTFMIQELQGQLALAVKTLPGEDPAELISTLTDFQADALAAAAAAEASAVAAAASAASALAKENSMLRWRGTWVTATAYAPSDIVFNSGSSYICVVAHTSGTFGTDLGANRWALFAQQGAAGAGTGDMLKSENLSGLANVATARANLGAQLADAKLTALAAPTYIRGDIIRVGASGLEKLGKGAATEVLGGDGTDTLWVKRAKTTRDQKPGSGASQLFSGLPAGLEDIDLLADFISMSAGATLRVQLGHAGGLVTSGYTAFYASLSTGLLPNISTASTHGILGGVLSGPGFVISKANLQRVYAVGHIWMLNFTGFRTEDNVSQHGFFRVDLGAELTQIQVFPSAGVFDNGYFTLKW